VIEPTLQDAMHCYGSASMKTFVVVMLSLFSCLQYQLWFSDDANVQSVSSLKQVFLAETNKVISLKKRNGTLLAEISNLRHGTAALEERARNDLGMIKEGEAFYQVVEG